MIGTLAESGSWLPAEKSKPPRGQMFPLFAWRSGAREEVEVKDGRRPPPQAVLRILEFDFLTRIIAFMQSMGFWRWASAPRIAPTL